MEITLKKCELLGIYIGVVQEETVDMGPVREKSLAVCPILEDGTPEMDGNEYNLGEFYECPQQHKPMLQAMFPEALDAVDRIIFYEV